MAKVCYCELCGAEYDPADYGQGEVTAIKPGAEAWCEQCGTITVLTDEKP